MHRTGARACPPRTRTLPPTWPTCRWNWCAAGSTGTNLLRVTQLVNKTNQFNLTTSRYSEQQVLAFLREPDAIGLQCRLVDRLGDHGIIAVVLARGRPDATFDIDTWLMSCRVLGRGVEQATLNVLAEHCIRKGGRELIGIYRPTEKNMMVHDLYERLGFGRVSDLETGTTNRLELSSFEPFRTPIRIMERAS